MKQKKYYKNNDRKKNFTVKYNRQSKEKKIDRINGYLILAIAWYFASLGAFWCLDRVGLFCR